MAVCFCYVDLSDIKFLPCGLSPLSLSLFSPPSLSPRGIVGCSGPPAADTVPNSTLMSINQDIHRLSSPFFSPGWQCVGPSSAPPLTPPRPPCGRGPCLLLRPLLSVSSHLDPSFNRLCRICLAPLTFPQNCARSLSLSPPKFQDFIFISKCRYMKLRASASPPLRLAASANHHVDSRRPRMTAVVWDRS